MVVVKRGAEELGTFGYSVRTGGSFCPLLALIRR